jgi:hypothetical protein
MDEAARKIRLLAEAVIGSAKDRESLMDLSAVAALPSASVALVESIVSQMERKLGSIESGLVATMATFESLYDTIGESSLFLMAALWGIAARINDLYDVCDGIDLWIANNLTPRLRSQLLDLALAQSDDTIAAHYKQLAGLK